MPRHRWRVGHSSREILVKILSIHFVFLCFVLCIFCICTFLFKIWRVGHSSREILVKFLLTTIITRKTSCISEISPRCYYSRKILSFYKHHFLHIFLPICCSFCTLKHTLKQQKYSLHKFDLIYHRNFFEGEPLVQEVSTAELNHQVKKLFC